MSIRIDAADQTDVYQRYALRSNRSYRRQQRTRAEQKVHTILHQRIRDATPAKGYRLRSPKPDSRSYKRFLPAQNPPKKKIRKPERKTPEYVVPSLTQMPPDFRLTQSTAPKEVLQIVKEQIKEMDEEPFETIPQKMLDEIEKCRSAISRRGFPGNVAICHINDTVGEGVFLKRSAEAIEPGDFIGVYAGEYKILTWDEMEVHDGAYSFDLLEEVTLNPSQSKAFKKRTGFTGETDDLLILIDGKSKGNFTRNINGSEKRSNAMAVFFQMPDGRVEVVIQATKKILPGEQILISYGNKYWKTQGVKPLEMTPSSYMLQ